MINKIRFKMFETNSSSTHSCLVCKTEWYEKWKDGYYYIILDNSWISRNYPDIPVIDGMFVDTGYIDRIFIDKFTLGDLIKYRERYENTYGTEEEEIDIFLKEKGYESINSFLNEISIYSYKSLLNYTMNSSFEEMEVYGMKGVTVIQIEGIY